MSAAPPALREVGCASPRPAGLGYVWLTAPRALEGFRNYRGLYQGCEECVGGPAAKSQAHLLVLMPRSVGWDRNKLTQAKRRGVEGPRRCLSVECSSELSGHKRQGK